MGAGLPPKRGGALYDGKLQILKKWPQRDHGKMKKKEIDWIALRAPKWFHGCRNGGSVASVASPSHVVQPPVKSTVTMFGKLGLRATVRSAVLALICCLLIGDLSAATTTPKKKKRTHTTAQS